MGTKKKIILISVVSGTIGLVLVFFVIYPLVKRAAEGSKKIIEIKKEITLSQGRTGNISHVRSEFDRIKPSSDQIDNLFINTEAPIDFIEFLETTAASIDLLIEINPVSLKEEKKEDPWEAVGFQLNLVGSSKESLVFLEKLENAPYLIDIQNLSISKLEEQDLRSQRYEGFSAGDLVLNLKIKALAR